MQKLKVLDLFSGIGGFSLGLERTGGFETVAFCEIDPYCRAVLRKHWPKVKQFEDVRKINRYSFIWGLIDRPDVIVGGFPCQDISQSGKGAGIDGARSGLWKHFARLIGEFRPRYVIVENVAALLGRGMERVLGDLANLGYDAEWRVIRGCDVGRPILRQRVWIVAFPMRQGRERRFQYLGSLGITPQASAERRDEAVRTLGPLVDYLGSVRGPDGVSVQMERRRISMCGNAVVPAIPEIIGRAIMTTQTPEG